MKGKIKKRIICFVCCKSRTTTKEKRFSHHITSQSVELLNKETAKGIHYAIVNTVLPINGEEHQVLVTGQYNDQYDISSGECLIKSREFKIHFINKST